MSVKTYDEILRLLLSGVEYYMDTRVGSPAYIMASAMAIRVQELYDYMQNMEDNAYLDTAEGEWLDMLAKFYALTRREETKAVVKIEGGTGLEVGDRVTSGETEYVIVQKEDDYLLAECSVKGEAGNAYTGDVFPVGNAVTEDAAAITKIVAAAVDRESDESLRKRCVEHITCPVCTGNLTYYKDILHKIDAIGAGKVYAAAEGAGTVKVIVTNPENEVPDDELVSYVKNLIDPEDKEGLGYGLAPIGHKVRVEKVEAVDINIEVEVSGDYVQAYYMRHGKQKAIDAVKALNKQWGDCDNLIVRDRVIEDCFFELGAADVNVISINSMQNRLILEENQIIGSVEINGN